MKVGNKPSAFSFKPWVPTEQKETNNQKKDLNLLSPTLPASPKAGKFPRTRTPPHKPQHLSHKSLTPKSTSTPKYLTRSQNSSPRTTPPLSPHSLSPKSPRTPGFLSTPTFNSRSASSPKELASPRSRSFSLGSIPSPEHFLFSARHIRYDVRTSSLYSGTVEYAKASGFIYNVTHCYLKFIVSKLPFEGEDFSDEPIANDTEADKAMLQVVYNPKEVSAEMERITSIFVDVLLPSVTSIDLSAIGIATACKDFFPNMKPEYSSLTLCYENERWNFDDALLSSPDPCTLDFKLIKPDAVFHELAQCIESGLDPRGYEVQEILKQHHTSVEQTMELFVELIKAQTTYPKFQRKLDKIHPQLAEYVSEAINVFAATSSS